jgi:hypothetical protein
MDNKRGILFLLYYICEIRHEHFMNPPHNNSYSYYPTVELGFCRVSFKYPNSQSNEFVSDSHCRIVSVEFDLTQ